VISRILPFTDSTRPLDMLYSIAARMPARCLVIRRDRVSNSSMPLVRAKSIQLFRALVRAIHRSFGVLVFRQQLIRSHSSDLILQAGQLRYENNETTREAVWTEGFVVTTWSPDRGGRPAPPAFDVSAQRERRAGLNWSSDGPAHPAYFPGSCCAPRPR
jgi:hypothetical protein